MLKDTITNFIHAISDQGNTILSKSFVYVGVGGSSVGIADGVTGFLTDSTTGGLNIGALCGIGGFLCLAIKTAVESYFQRKKDKREEERDKREQELHELLMSQKSNES